MTTRLILMTTNKVKSRTLLWQIMTTTTPDIVPALRLEVAIHLQELPFSLLVKEDEDTPPLATAETEELWPAQFDSEFYRKAGFVYKQPTNISDLHLISKTTIIRACRLYGVRRFGIWSREPLKIFRRWFQNEVAGRYNTLRPMGYGEDLVRKQTEDTLRWLEEKRQWDVPRRRMILDRYERGGRRIRPVDLRRSWRIMERHVQARRSFGKEELGFKGADSPL
jgi:hypothetical protein